MEGGVGLEGGQGGCEWRSEAFVKIEKKGGGGGGGGGQGGCERRSEVFVEIKKKCLFVFFFGGGGGRVGGGVGLGEGVRVDVYGEVKLL